MSSKRSNLPLCIALIVLASALFLQAQTYSPWANVENLGSVVNSSTSDSCMFIASSGLSLYFGSSRPGGLGGLDLYVAQRATKKDPWGEPKPLAPGMNSSGFDHLPFITPDGHTMIFASNRSGGAGGNDLYMSFRLNTADDFAWEAPVRIAELSTAGDEYGPWGYIDRETRRLVLYFTTKQPGSTTGYDIYATARQADGKFAEPQIVQELSTPVDDVMPTIREDGLELYLTSNRTGTIGSVDIWRSSRASTGEPWSVPVNATPLNSSAGEQRAGMSSDGREIYFFSARPGGIGGSDIYRATRTKTTLIPIVGATRGAHGSDFRTSAQLGNPGNTEVAGRLVFHPAGVEASPNDPQLAYRLGPYESRAFENVVASIGVSGVGSLEIVPERGAAPASSFRIENGSGFVTVPAVDADSVMSAGQRSAMKMPSDTERFRVNVGIRTLENGATIWFCSHEPDGTYIPGHTRYFPPNYLVQMPVEELHSGAVKADRMLMFTVKAGSAVIFGSTLENNGHTSTLQILRKIDD